MSIDTLFNPSSIALIGASHTEEKLGGITLKNLLRFKGEVFPVNPGYNELMGLRAYHSIEEIGRPVDVVIIIRPAEEVPHIIRRLKGISRYAIVMSSGFAEVGEHELQEDVKRAGKEAGIRMLGPNCMGIYNPYKRLDTFFLPYERLRRPRKGNIAVVSQSGAVISCIMSSLRESGMGVSKVIGYGNAIDIDEADIYEYLLNDKETDVVVSYIESISDGRRFIEKARLLSDKKPLIVLKSGKGEKGKSAALSHTGRLAGRYEVFHSVLKQFGIREIEDFEGLIDSAKALSYQWARGKVQGGRRVLIITNGGGSGVLAVDECMRQGLDVTDLPNEKRERLKALFPHFYGINNPIDLTAQVRDEDYITVLNELRDYYDGFLIIALPNVTGITEGLAGLMREFNSGLDKPLVFHLSPSGITKRLTILLERAGIPVYPTPERAVRGLTALLG
ncbi:MAG: acetate--CoA ligase family protein [Thermodesulfovibrionia bacterium]